MTPALLEKNSNMRLQSHWAVVKLKKSQAVTVQNPRTEHMHNNNCCILYRVYQKYAFVISNITNA